MTASASIRRAARERFGYDELRPGQEDAIASVLDGRDTLAVLPTGWGKSAIYQIATTLLDGPSVVVSPLVALQHDQVLALEAADAGAATQLNSTMAAGRREERLADLEEGDLEFLLLAPEQLANDEVVDRLVAARPSLFVVDEAHCISSWGHDFRPDYLRLGTVVERLGRPVVLALTATAAPPVRDEIVSRLGMTDPALVVRGFDRPNIHLSVQRFVDADDKHQAVIDAVVNATRPGLVYAATRKATEAVAADLTGSDVKAVAYHAGMSKGQRTSAQAAFMAGEAGVVVATTAFGMGIDKADIRFVFHHDVPDSLDSYYQEVGRAGRDGEPARGVLFYRQEDLGLRRFFASSGKRGQEHVAAVAEQVADADRPLEVGELGERTDLPESRLGVAVTRLEDAGAVEVVSEGRVVAGDGLPADAVKEAADAAERHHQADKSRVEMMRAYAETRSCRRQALLAYFGEQMSAPCGNCDVCDRRGGDQGSAARQPWPVGSHVRHGSWGRGQVMRYEDDTMAVLFDDVGYKTLSVDLVAGGGLLEPM